MASGATSDGIVHVIAARNARVSAFASGALDTMLWLCAHSQPMATPSPHVMLRRSVKACGLTHQDLARATGRDRSTVWRWLSVRHPTRPDEASRRILEKLIGIPADAWLTPRERAALERVAPLDAA